MQGPEILAKYVEAFVLSMRSIAADEKAKTPEEKAAAADLKAKSSAIMDKLPGLKEERLFIFYRRIAKAEGSIALLQDDLAAAHIVLAEKLEGLKSSAWKWAGAAKAKEPSHVTAQREYIAALEEAIAGVQKKVVPDHAFVRKIHDSDAYYEALRLYFAGTGPCPPAYKAKVDAERATFLRETPPWIPPPGPGPFRDYTPACMR